MREWLEKIGLTLAIVTSVAGAMLYLDSNYATAADLKRLEQNLKRDRIQDRIKDVEQKVFELEFKQRQMRQNFNALDAAILERLQNELKDLQARARNLEK